MKDNNIIEFLKQSNAIENVYDDFALQTALKAWDFIMQEKELNIKNILKTHDILMEGKLEKSLRGVFRKVNVSVGKEEIVGVVDDKIVTRFKVTGEVLPYQEVRKEIARWLVVANGVESVALSPSTVEDFIRNCHIWFEKTHPFVDGNGRMGRILLNWQRVKVGLPVLIIRADEREEYYKWFKFSSEKNGVGEDFSQKTNSFHIKGGDEK